MLADDALFGFADACGGRIVLHAVGDTGSSEVRRYRNQLRVADQLSIGCATAETGNRPAFLFHLEDMIYYFVESP